MVRLLLEHKADLDAKTRVGWTALHWAIKNKHRAVVRLLQSTAHNLAEENADELADDDDEEDDDEEDDHEEDDDEEDDHEEDDDEEDDYEEDDDDEEADVTVANNGGWDTVELSIE